MLAGTLALDLVWLAGLVGLGSLSFHVALLIAAAVGGVLGVALAFVGGAYTWIGAAALLAAVTPKPRPGRHALMKGRDFYAWVLQFVIRRWLDVPLVQFLWTQGSLPRWLVFRMLGARIQLGANMSSDVIVLDPGLFMMKRGAMIGAGAGLASHMIINDKLVCGAIELHEGALVAAQAGIGPGVIVHKRALIEPGARILAFSEIGEGARIGAHALIGVRVRVGAGATVDRMAHVPDDTVIPDGGHFPPAG
jgi:acetyltransferase-like isoleucine patch superfamily enzyme